MITDELPPLPTPSTMSLGHMPGLGARTEATFDYYTADQMHAYARAALAAALAVRQGEPVAWMVTGTDGRHYIFRINKPEISEGETLSPLYAHPAPAEPSAWVACADRLPAVETPVLILCKGQLRVGELRWDTPGYEDTYQAFQYWDDPDDDGQCWEWGDITHWMPAPPLPAAPTPLRWPHDDMGTACDDMDALRRGLVGPV
jgi:hypothetical protein